MSVRFNGLMATIVPTSVGAKDKIQAAVLGWANSVSDADPDMGWFAFVLDTRDGEFGAIYSDRLRSDLKMGDLQYVQMVPPKQKIETDDDHEVVTGKDIIVEQQAALTESQWMVLVEKALAGDAIMMSIVGLLAESLEQSEALAAAVAGVLFPKMYPKMLEDLWVRLLPAMQTKIAGLPVLTDEAGLMSDEQIKAAVAEALPTMLSEQLPMLMDGAMKRVLPSFLPNWDGLVAANVRQLFDERFEVQSRLVSEWLAGEKKLLKASVEEYQLALVGAGDLAGLKALVERNVDQSKEAVTIANANGTQVAKNLKVLQGVQAQITEGIERDKIQQVELVELLDNAKKQLILITVNQESVAKSAEKIKAFDEWVAKVKPSFEKLDQFLLNEYDQLKASLESSGADIEMINSLQDTILKVSGEADRIGDAFTEFEKKLVAAEESDEIEALRSSFNELRDELKRIGGMVAESKPLDSQAIEVIEEPEELDEMADPAMVT